MDSRSMSIMFRRATIVNSLISIVWTIIIVLPLEPFSLLLRVIVGGGPGIWFLLAYILHIIIGSGVFTGFSYLYYLIEDSSNIKAENIFNLTGFFLLFIGVNITLIVLAVAGAIGGYYLNILHLPIEIVRETLEPFVNPLRILSIVTVIGALLCLEPFLRIDFRGRTL